MKPEKRQPGTGSLVILLLMSAVLLWAVSASGEIYRWVDERGVTHFSDTPPGNESGSKIRKETSGTGTLSVVPGPARPGAQPAGNRTHEPSEVRINRNARVEIYTTSW